MSSVKEVIISVPFAVISQFRSELLRKRLLRLVVGLLVLFVALSLVTRSAGLLHLDVAVTQEVQERHSGSWTVLPISLRF